MALLSISKQIIYKTGDLFPNPDDLETALGIVYWLIDGVDVR